MIVAMMLRMIVLLHTTTTTNNNNDDDNNNSNNDNNKTEGAPRALYGIANNVTPGLRYNIIALYVIIC